MIKPVIKPQKPKIINSFNCSNVVLLKSFLKEQFEQAKQIYLEIPDGMILHHFRARHGLPVKGKSLGGWYGNNFYDIFGQFLSGFSRMYSITKDRNLLEKTNNLLYGWAETIEKDGFFFKTDKPNAPHYIFDKMVGGLVDIYQYTENIDSIKFLKKITQWAIKNLDTKNEYAHCYADGATEWYTLPENLYRAFVLTGDENYKELADKFLYKQYYSFYFKDDYKGLMQASYNSKYRRYHAYSHINTLSSAAMAYYVTGDEYYLKTIINAYRIINETQLFNTGGFGPGETLLEVPLKIETIYSENFHFEVNCGSLAAFKLSKYLMEDTGDSKYGNWVEKLVYNCIGASIPTEKNGSVMYYANYNINGASKETSNPWSCCSGTYPITVSEYHNQIYFKDSKGIYINLFIPSELKTIINNQEVIIRINTDFPKKDTIIISFDLKNNLEFELSIRNPDWAPLDKRVIINNTETKYEETSGWIKLKKNWGKNDKIKIKLPIKTTESFLDKNYNSPSCITYGPLVLAALSDKIPNIKFTGIDRKIKLQRDNTFVYSNRRENKIVFKPLYEVGKKQKYFIYFDNKKIERIPYKKINLGPNPSFWTTEKLGHPVFTEKIRKNASEIVTTVPQGILGNMNEIYTGYLTAVSVKPGAFFEYKFKGSGILLMAYQLPTGGKAKTFVDGNFIETIDFFGFVKGVPKFWEIKDLENKFHTLKILNDADSNIYSEGFSINVRHLRIYQ